MSKDAGREVEAQTCGTCDGSEACAQKINECPFWAPKKAPKPPVTPACERCAYSAEPRTVLAKTGDGVKDAVYSNVAVCECRRNAPGSAVVLSRQNMDAYHGIWPLVRLSDWCGEWKGRGEK